ncbi:MAG: Flagellar hook-associated protein FlgK/Flagellar hook protein FlgE [Verrucomicrobia bacterium]|nr:MAG: Flagellar hook-associated protein FlgK/Flagellar hook protein FlgE [Verrucomicrobiota bacterium]
MGGLFGNLVQASKALMANQVAIQVTGRNLANVNNPEYARLRVKMGDRYVEQTPHGPEGSGVEVLQVQQMRDAFLDAQVVRHASDNGSLDAQQTILANLELILGNHLNSAADPAAIADASNSTTGIGAALDEFFNAFSALAANPSDLPSKSAALNAAAILADRLNLADQRVAGSQVDQEGQIKSDVAKANGLLADIAQLNFQIRQAADVEAGGAVDLVDSRQAKLEQLASLVKLDITKDSENPSELNISLGGVVLVAQAQLVHQIGYLSEQGAADLSAAGSLKNRTQGFEIGSYDVAGEFVPTVASTGGAAMLRPTDSVAALSVLPAGTTIIARIDNSTLQMSQKATQTGYFGLTVNGVENARVGYATSGSNIITLSPATGYEVVPAGGSLQGRFQATFGAPTATYMTAKGIRSQLADLASTIQTQVNAIYNPGQTGSDLFVPAEVDLTAASSQTVAGSRNVTVANTAGLVVGMHVSGCGIPSGATVASIFNSTSFSLNVPASLSVASFGPTSLTGVSTNGSKQVSISSTVGLSVGMQITGAGIPAGATIASIKDGTTFLLNVAAPAGVSTLTATASLKSSRNLLEVPSTLTASSLLAAPAGSPASANTFALKIAALRDLSLQWNSVVSGGAAFGAKFSDFGRGMVTSLAQTIQTVGTRAEEAQVVGDAIKAQRDSVSGVSLDEETADLLRFQKAYQANAKVISVIDEMLSSLIGMIR